MTLEESDKTFIRELVTSALKENNAELDKKFVTADAASKMVEQGVTKGFEALKLDEKISESLKKHAPPPDDKATGKNKGGGDDKGSSLANDPEFLRMKEEQERLQRQLREAEESRQRAEQRQREQQMEAAAKDALAQAGIPADRHSHALAYLRTLKTDDGKPVLDVRDDGTAVWRAQRKGYVDELGVSDGVKSWTSSDDGKVYMPARGTQGTGDGAGGNGGPPGPQSAPRTQDGSVDFGEIGRRLSGALKGARIN